MSTLKPTSDDGECSQAALLKKLSELPPKTRRTKRQTTLMERVTAWYEHLKSAQERGYTWEELAEMMSEAGISITAGTLRKYMAKAKKEQGTASAKPARSSTSSALPPDSRKPSSNFSPERQARLINRKAVPDDIESEFTNL